uniref:Uncharacterized protein n=1 Tax=Solanum lycopersicum TaxID=4081 RepID=A0A3Q7EFZ7_SOLLC
MGRTVAVSSRTSLSFVKTLPHASLPMVVSMNPNVEVKNASPMAIPVAKRALAGRPAPSSFPTLLETEALRADGNVYMRDVVCITIADAASGTSGHNARRFLFTQSCPSSTI